MTYTCDPAKPEKVNAVERERRKRAVLAPFGSWDGRSYFVVTSSPKPLLPGEAHCSRCAPDLTPTRFVVQGNTPEHACEVLRWEVNCGDDTLSAVPATAEALLNLLHFTDGVCQPSSVV